MSEEQKQVESDVITTASDVQEEQETKQPGIIAGYQVGVKQDGNFFFDILGERAGLLELLGLHEFAAARLKQSLMNMTESGDRLIHEVGNGLNIVNQKLDAVLQELGGLLKQLEVVEETEEESKEEPEEEVVSEEAKEEEAPVEE